MNLSLFSAATGMQAQQMNLDTIANNLANVNTLGFKKSRIEFQDLLYQNPRAVGADNGGGNRIPTGVEIGNGSQVVSTSKIFTQGTLTQTDGELDIAIQGDGFFEVQRPDGSTAYTRDGSFQISSTGQVVTSDGLPVLSGFQTLPSDKTAVSISQTGLVTVRTPAGDSTFQLQIARFANPAGLVNLGGNTLAESSSSGAPELGTPSDSGFGSTMQGYVEGSNVNVVSEMVAMIMAQRAYEINSKSIQASDDMLQQINNLKR